MKKEPREYALADLFPRHTLEDILPEPEDVRLRNNEKEIDEYLKNLSKYIGRKLTEHEEDRFLEIVDEYTPKKSDGKYLTDLIPFEYAWEIYQAKRDIEWRKFHVFW